MKLLAPCLLSLLCLACSTPAQLTNPGKKVEIVTSLTPDQASHFTDIGAVVVEQSWQFHGDEKDAKDQLRNYAARDGAELILLQSQGREPCEVDSSKSCLFLRGRKYRRADSNERPSEQL